MCRNKHDMDKMTKKKFDSPLPLFNNDAYMRDLISGDAYMRSSALRS